MITVVVPVGPLAAHKRWIGECLESVRAQTLPPSEVLIIDDMADIEADPEFNRWRDALTMRGIAVNVWRSPWRVGVAAAFNFGVSLARNECTFMLGADDTLEPECLARCVNAYERVDEETRRKTLFFVGVHYTDGRPDPDQFIACNAAMVTRSFWKHCGGFAPETAVGAPDAALISQMMVHRDCGDYIGVSEGHMLYNVRSHPDQDTATRGPWQHVILEVRNILTEQWAPPEWCRSEP